MKILNLYAGIGGNRKLWGNEHKIPEKLDYKYENIYHNISKCKHSEIRIIDKINEIIDYLKKIEQKRKNK